MRRRGLVLASLIRLKQICNHPSQWLRDGDYVPEPAASSRGSRRSAEDSARQEKVLVFTQFRELTEPLAAFLEQVFGAAGLVLHGETRCASGRRWSRGPDRRGALFRAFAQGGRHGLNLTAASHVVHFDRCGTLPSRSRPPIAPSASARSGTCWCTSSSAAARWREDRRHAGRETGLAGELLEGGAEAHLTEMSDADLLRTFPSISTARSTTRPDQEGDG